MKIRNGFVSNSSSSSFMVKGGSTIAQIATMMMYEIKSDWENSSWAEEHGIPEDFLKALEWLHSNIEHDDPIMFPWSTNYETFIWRDKDGICVETCNNHNWDLVGGVYDYDDYHFNFPTNVYSYSFLDLSDMENKTKQQFMDEYNERYENESS